MQGAETPNDIVMHSVGRIGFSHASRLCCFLQVAQWRESVCVLILYAFALTLPLCRGHGRNHR
jgi:hypothetical protein